MTVLCSSEDIVQILQSQLFLFDTSVPFGCLSGMPKPLVNQLLNYYAKVVLLHCRYKDQLLLLLIPEVSGVSYDLVCFIIVTNGLISDIGVCSSFNDKPINEAAIGPIGKDLFVKEQDDLLSDLKDIPRKACDRRVC